MKGNADGNFFLAWPRSATITHSEMASSESRSRGHLSPFHEVISWGSTAIEKPPHPPTHLGPQVTWKGEYIFEETLCGDSQIIHRRDPAGEKGKG